MTRTGIRGHPGRLPAGLVAHGRKTPIGRCAVNRLWGDDWANVRSQWILDPSVTFLNHGSFGACPRPVLEAQAALREEMERQPVEFLDRRLPELIGNARDRVATFLRADPWGLAFVPNVTTGVATVLSNLSLEPGDEVLMTDHVYPAVRNAAARRCRDRHARLVVQPVPLPSSDTDDITESILHAVTPRTRLVIVDHVTSPTAVIFPVSSIVQGCRERGVPVLIDGAHAPGMLDVDLSALEPDFWTGNFHKWGCTPKGSAALYVLPEHRDAFRPLVTSHGFEGGFQPEFDWSGTVDPTAYLTIPAALDFIDGLGWERVRAHNHALVVYGRTVLAASLRTRIDIPESALGSMAIVPLPEGIAETKEAALRLQAELYRMHRIEVPIVAWNGRGYVRLSAYVYNHPGEFERLAAAVPTLLEDRTVAPAPGAQGASLYNPSDVVEEASGH